MSDESGPRPGSECDAECIGEHLRAVYLTAPAADVADTHLARIFAAAAAMPATAPRVVDVGAQRRARRLTAAVLAGGAFALTGGLAAAGQLPAPVQRGVSKLVSPVGIHVPATRAHLNDELPAAVLPSTGKAGEAGKAGDHETPAPAPPGLGGVDPSQSDDAPGRGGNDPGNAGNPPGLAGDAPSTAPTPPTTVHTDPTPSESKKPKDDVTTSVPEATTTTAKAPGGGGNNQGNNDQGNAPPDTGETAQ